MTAFAQSLSCTGLDEKLAWIEIYLWMKSLFIYVYTCTYIHTCKSLPKKTGAGFLWPQRKSSKSSSQHLVVHEIQCLGTAVALRQVYKT